MKCSFWDICWHCFPRAINRLAILINGHFNTQPAERREENVDERFNPLAWAITFFTIWYTLLAIHNNQGFGWACFGMSVVYWFQYMSGL